MLKRFPPDDPREWINRARSGLTLARARGEGVYLEDLCFQAQQAAEKAIKALLVHRKVRFSYVHDIGQLLSELEGSGFPIPDPIRKAARLTRFAVFTRYPATVTSVTENEWTEALALAEEVVHWAEGILAPAPSDAEPPEAAETE